MQDHGYAWVVLAASVFGFSIIASIMQTMTLMFQALMGKFNTSAGFAGNMGGVYAAVTHIMGTY